ncbi:helix-turn-helix domain-containing protein [Dactylosporangium roseum]|uniref:Helix-turn-helix domain-containing protein n=1 Tax=Dactylosporangium roseum TaxID=47989 RepID=A0ABY5Z5A0_9ACTN|nr:XRE family transcriptional regulator [Dactylosporangium roseum]UWZ37022.1 helix-turn-helix domain-containing protein [Dactylosporangium roseum]
MDIRKPPLELIATALKREREREKLSLSEVAKRAGIAKSTLSQLEAGAGNPNIETLWALAVALNVPFSRLVEAPPTAPHVIRAGTGPVFKSEQADFVGTLLATCPPGARRDIYLMTIEMGGARKAEAHLPGTVEHVVMIGGRLRVGPEDSPVDLDVHDYASFPGDVAHAYEALLPGTSFALVMEHR